METLTTISGEDSIDKGYMETEYNGYKLEIIPGWKLCDHVPEDVDTEDGKWLVNSGSFTRRLFAIGNTEKENKRYYGSYYIWYEKYNCKVGHIFTKKSYYEVDLRDGMMSYGFKFKKCINLLDIAVCMVKMFNNRGKRKRQNKISLK